MPSFPTPTCLFGADPKLLPIGAPLPYIALNHQAFDLLPSTRKREKVTIRSSGLLRYYIATPDLVSTSGSFPCFSIQHDNLSSIWTSSVSFLISVLVPYLFVSTAANMAVFVDFGDDDVESTPQNATGPFNWPHSDPTNTVMAVSGSASHNPEPQSESSSQQVNLNKDNPAAEALACYP